MKKFNFLSLTLLAALNFIFTGCSKDEDHNHDHLHDGRVVLHFDHVFGANQEEFQLNKEFTHPRLGEKMTFTTFKYYVSNIRLVNKDGSKVEFPDSYFIIDAGGSNQIILDNVKGGEYTGVELMMGVDSVRNESGAQTGALDPMNGMFWSWNSGYIMIKAEGTSPDAESGNFSFHLGGFKGENKVQTHKNFSFGTDVLTVDGDREAEIHILANVARLWHSAEKIAVRSKMQMPGPVAKSMSADFYEGIRFDHIHN